MLGESTERIRADIAHDDCLDARVDELGRGLMTGPVEAFGAEPVIEHFERLLFGIVNDETLCSAGVEIHIRGEPFAGRRNCNFHNDIGLMLLF